MRATTAAEMEMPEADPKTQWGSGESHCRSAVVSLPGASLCREAEVVAANAAPAAARAALSHTRAGLDYFDSSPGPNIVRETTDSRRVHMEPVVLVEGGG
jgi:hypothetical protein